MKSVRLFAVAVLALLMAVHGFQPVSAYVGTLDQQQQTVMTDDYNLDYEQFLAQRFTAGLTGGLTEVDLVIGCMSSTTCEGYPGVTVEIHLGDPNGALLGSTSLPGSAFPIFSGPNPSGFITFTFSSPSTVVAGNAYTIVMTTDGAYGATYGSQNPYPAGDLWYKMGGLWYVDSMDDIAFKTYVDTDNFKGYPTMFTGGGTANATIIDGYSISHGPCFAANTIDVVGTNLIAGSLIPYATSDGLDAKLDIWAAYPVGSTIVLDVTGNIITVGGPPVNYVWKYYNDLGTLPAHFDSNTVHVPSTGHTYSMMNDYFQGLPVTDYAIVELYTDASGRTVLLVAGISGYASYYASQWLAQKTLDGTIRTYNAHAIILRLNDADGDPEGTPPIITVEETV